MANWASVRLVIRGDGSEIQRFVAEEDRHLQALNMWYEAGRCGGRFFDRDGVAGMADVQSVTYEGEARWSPNGDYLLEVSREFPVLTFDLWASEMNGGWEMRGVVSNGEEIWGYDLQHDILVPPVAEHPDEDEDSLSGEDVGVMPDSVPERERMSAEQMADWFESLGPDGRRRLAGFLATDGYLPLEYTDAEIRPDRSGKVAGPTDTREPLGCDGDPEAMVPKA